MTNDATSQTSPAVPGAKRKRSLLFVALTYLWVPLSFIVPYLLMNQMAIQSYRPEERVVTHPLARRIEDARGEAINSGLVGLLVASVIFAMWKIDRRIGDHEKDFNDGRVVTIIVALAFFVWVVWTAAGHIMMRASYEINDIPPQLPGLDTPHF